MAGDDLHTRYPPVGIVSRVISRGNAPAGAPFRLNCSAQRIEWQIYFAIASGSDLFIFLVFGIRS